MDIESLVAQLDARQRTSEHRIRDLEQEVHDLRELTKAIAVTNESVRQLKDRVEELHTDLKALTVLPAKRWDTVITTLITAVTSALAGALTALIL